MAATLQSSSSSLSLSITNPLVLYRALLATQRIRPDPAQHRLALELQKLYFRLKDYDPEIEYRWRLEKAARLSHKLGRRNERERKAVFDDGPTPCRFSMSSIFGIDEGAASMLALTRTVPIHDSAMEIDSPQGMLLYGEVGRGKSMLLDLLYSSLPTKKKRRWHFNTFILDIFRRLELARIERSNLPKGLALEHEHVVLSLARETMETSPILFLDEFQMPDRVSGKLVHSFLTGFFSLGGVLVASSNRMPEELAKASGVEFARMGGIPKWGRGGQFWEKLSIGQRQARSDFGMFVEVLKKRCEIWEMEGERDWRREDETAAAAPPAEDDLEMDREEAAAVLETLSEASIAPSESISANSDSSSADTPKHYHITEPTLSSSPLPSPSEELQHALKTLNPTATWQPTTIVVYARPVHLATTNTASGIALLPFPQLCQANLGPADYISICSTFHTLVVTQIPVLALSMKNEARRFITFLDACYEAHCRLIIEAAAPPDRLFFPETRARRGSANMLDEGDSLTSEAFSEMYQDSTAPFRPNISSYVGTNENERENNMAPPPSLHSRDLRSVLADEDADFGPTYGNRRSSGPSSSTADYDDDDDSNNSNNSNIALDERHNPAIRQGPDFTRAAGAFTGQDEQFAYKRARSRLWELCGRRWWHERRADNVTSWWTPVLHEGRFWEKKNTDTSTGAHAHAHADPTARPAGDAKQDALFRHAASPFRTSAEPPPRFGWQHAWGMMRWGRKAGEWGKGVEGNRRKATRGPASRESGEEGKRP